MGGASIPPLVAPALAWLLGLLLADSLALPLRLWLSAAGAALVGAVLAHRHMPPPNHARLAAILLLAFALGGARLAAARPSSDDLALAAFNDLPEPVTVTGVVAAYPDVRGSRTRLRVEAHTIGLEDGRELPARGMLLATVSRYPEWRYGDEVRLRGKLGTPDEMIEDFAYREYLARQGIFSVMDYAGGERLASGRASTFFAALYALRDRARATIVAMLPEPHAGLLAGILLGVDDGIPRTLMERFNITGTTHVLVISGANFAIVAGVLNLLAVRVAGGRRGMWIAVLGIGVYALLVGAEPSVQRAAIMGALYVIARGIGRESLALNSLAAATVALTMLNPFTLWDLGFQLSTLATLGLILYAPPLTRRFNNALVSLGPRRAVVTGLLNEALIITLAAQLATTPLIVATFERLSLVSLLANLFILPVQGWVMLGGGLATVAGLIWLPLGQLFGFLPWLALHWTVMVVEWASRVPWASVQIEGFRGVWLTATYLVLFGALFRTRIEGHARAVREALRRAFGSGRPVAEPLLAVLALAALLPWIAWRYTPDGRLHLFVLDVGQGDALLIVTPEGRQVVVDGGPSGQSLLAGLAPHLPPWDRHLDLVVLTHPDEDHLGGFPDLLERYEVARVLQPGTQAGTALFAEWRRRLEGEGAQVIGARRGQRIFLGPGLWLEVLHPAEARAGEETNGNSVVLRLRYGRVCALLTGDIEAEGEARLVANGLAPCAILKVAHHGSETSSTAAFLGALRPALALISVGPANGFGHPAAGVLGRLGEVGARVLRTDRHGTIEIISDGQRLWVRTER